MGVVEVDCAWHPVESFCGQPRLANVTHIVLNNALDRDLGVAATRWHGLVCIEFKITENNRSSLKKLIIDNSTCCSNQEHKALINVELDKLEELYMRNTHLIRDIQQLCGHFTALKILGCHTMQYTPSILCAIAQHLPRMTDFRVP